MAVRRREAGQAFPIYITVVAGLLFLALAYFAVGQAAVARNSGQGAADAAALAAAMDARDQIGDGLLGSLLDPDALEDLLNGEGFGPGAACAEAQRLAARNDADVQDCDPVAWPHSGFTVEIRTRDTVGDSIIPGTEQKHAEATATAVLEPRCELKPGQPGKKLPLELQCEGGDLAIDPGDPDFVLDLGDLFSVHLKD